MIDEDEEKTVKKGAHALEKFLNIDPAPLEKVEFESKPLVKHEEYDGKDSELEEQMEDIYLKAMSGYVTLEQLLEGVEPKYRARLAEVALGYLNTGLNAVSSKTKHKEHKDKLSVKAKTAPTAGKTTNIVFSGDRNEAIRMAKRALEQADENEPIDGEIVKQDDSDKE